RAKPDYLDKCLSDCLGPEQRISLFYSSLLEMNTSSTISIKEEWEKELGAPLSDDIWRKALHNISTISINAHHCLI
ncbi:hypothetical protein XENOCAPTIV_010043, partial [Xenoophorus captivus]